MKRGRDVSKRSRRPLQILEVATSVRGRDVSSNEKGRDKDTMSRQISTNGPVNFKLTMRCIEIRAQLQNPINTQLLLKESSSWRLEREIWVAEGSCILIFFFFSFLFFFFLFLLFFRLVCIFV